MESLQNKLEKNQAILIKTGVYIAVVAGASAIYYFGKEALCKYGVLFCEAVERLWWSSFR